MSNAKFPTHGDNNDFLEGAHNANRFTARDVLTYLFSEAVEWKEDVDGDCDDGVERVFITHHICIKNGLLDELLDMALIPRGRYDESPLQRLQKAAEDDAATSSTDGGTDV